MKKARGGIILPGDDLHSDGAGHVAGCLYRFDR